MKKHLGKILVSGALIFASAPLLAQHYDDHGHDDHGHYDDHGHPNDHGHHHYKGMHDQGRHEGWYRKGGHMPEMYRGGHYVVNDWHRDHLRPPPHGYHWVRSDNGDFLLVAISTGIIASIIAGH